MLFRMEGVPLSELFRRRARTFRSGAQGSIVCGVPDPGTGIVLAAAVITGCVPINLFGGAGSITQEQPISWRCGCAIGQQRADTCSFTMDGNWGRSWAGDCDGPWAEYRREEDTI
jgi:hypothetical protein